MDENSKSKKGQKGNNLGNMWIHSPERNFELGAGLTPEMANNAFPKSSNFDVSSNELGGGSPKLRGGLPKPRGGSSSPALEGIVCPAVLISL